MVCGVLELVGIAALEESVLRCLPSTEPRTVAEIADDVRASPDAVRKALRRLVDLGLATRQGTAYTAIDPSGPLKGLLRERRDELNRVRQEIEDLSVSFHDRTAHGSAAHLVEIVEGRAAINARVEGALRRADEEVLAFDTPPYVVQAYGDTPAEVALLGRGVRCRAVYASEVLDVPERAERIRALVGLGEQARVAPSVPLKMIVIDRREVVLPLSVRGTRAQDSAMVVHKSGLCDAMAALFDAVWSQAIPLFTPPQTLEADLDAVDHAILELPNAGMKDDMIGRQLGISGRTIRRRVSELAERLGAASRFQIGAQAVRRGWI